MLMPTILLLISRLSKAIQSYVTLTSCPVQLCGDGQHCQFHPWACHGVSHPPLKKVQRQP